MGRIRALVLAVVVTVSVEVCAVVPLNVTDAGESVHVGASLAATGVMEQVRFTVPENPLVPTTLIVAVFPVVAPGWIEMDPGCEPLGGPKLGRLMVYAAEATALLLYPVATAMASIVSVEETAMGLELEKTVDPVVGAVPLVV